VLLISEIIVNSPFHKFYSKYLMAVIGFFKQTKEVTTLIVLMIYI